MKDLEELLSKKINKRSEVNYEITHIRETIRLLKEEKDAKRLQGIKSA